MKKALCVCLSVFLLVGTLPLFSFAKEIVEIVSASYQYELIEHLDAVQRTEKNAAGKLCTYDYYFVIEGYVDLVLRYSDGTLEETSAGDFFPELGDPYSAEVVSDQSPDHPWGLGKNPCKVTLGSLEKSFDVIIVPDPVESFYAKQTHPFISGVSADPDRYIECFLHYKDGTDEQLEVYTEASEILPAAPAPGKYTVPVSYERSAVTPVLYDFDLEFEVTENPYAGVRVDKAAPMELRLIRKDGSEEKVRITSIEPLEAGAFAVTTGIGVIRLTYDKKTGMLGLGECPAKKTAPAFWLNALVTLAARNHGTNNYYISASLWEIEGPNYVNTEGTDFVNDFTPGCVTEDILFALMTTALQCSSDPIPAVESDYGLYVSPQTLERAFKDVYGISGVDFTKADNYEPGYGLFFNFGDYDDSDNYDVGPEKLTFSYEGGRFVVRAFSTNPAAGPYFSERSYFTVTYDYQLHITGMYIHDIKTQPIRTGKLSAGDAVSAEDARLALRGAVGLEDYPIGSPAFLAADADHNWELSAADARLILRAAVGLEDLT